MAVSLVYRWLALGAANSALTGPSIFVGDLFRLTFSVQSSTASASRYTLVGTNDDGFQSALGAPSQTVAANGWSILTAVTAQGIYNIDPTGIRWMAVFRDTISVSASSNATVTFAGRT